MDNGKCVSLGVDPWASCKGLHKLLNELLEDLKQQVILVVVDATTWD